ncbi:DUF3158 family protein [Salmonella enterica]|uniref:DUF3158 family protein n=1 Tax=Salmonella enterica TaxID=28901 RepID=UPI003D322856
MTVTCSLGPVLTHSNSIFISRLSLKYLTSDHPARSGVSYLRWRNLDNNRSGSVALQESIQQPDVSDELRDALMALEWQRQVLNTQLSVVMFMLRQVQPLTTLV